MVSGRKETTSVSTIIIPLFGSDGRCRARVWQPCNPSDGASFDSGMTNGLYLMVRSVFSSTAARCPLLKH